MGNDSIMAELIKIVTETNSKVSTLTERVDNHIRNTDNNFTELNEKLDKNQEVMEKSVEKVDKVDDRLTKLEEKINAPGIFKTIGQGIVYLWSIKPIRQAAYLLSLPLFLAFSTHFGLPATVVSIFAAIFGM